MAFFESIIALDGFLLVSAAVVFVMLVIGIRKGDRARHLSDGPDTALDALTRRFLGGGIHRSSHDES
jgi:hypothetical protein